MNGYLKLFRQFRKWEWYSNIKTKTVFIHCLLCANYKPSTWRGVEIERGQFITSASKMGEELGLSRQEIRTALNNLQKTHEITIKSTNRYMLITIENWEKYQCFDDEATNRPTNQQPPNQPSIQPQEKNIKNIKNNIYSSNSDANTLFEKLWAMYPVKRGKSQVAMSAKKKHLLLGEEQMVRAIKRYTKELDQESWRKPQNGSTFFNSGYVDYLDENYVELKPRVEKKSGNSNVYVPEPPKYQKFETETEVIKGEAMPEEMRQRLKNLF